MIIKRLTVTRYINDSISDLVHSNKVFHSVSELFTKLEHERSEYEYNLNLQKNKINNLISLLMAAALLFVFAALYIIQLKIAKKAIKNQDYLNKELTSKAIFLARKNETFNKIESILTKNKHWFIKENQETIREIISEIKLAQNEEVWKEFELYFNKVHKDFYANLNVKFPNLTLNERRLCSLIRMNMTTKDISLITYQSSHTINIARFRLRKKLGITKQKDSIYKFLAQF